MTGSRGRLHCAPDAVLRRRSGLKWSRAGRDELPADIAELDFSVAEPVRQALRDCVELSDFGYPDFDHGLPVTLKGVFSERTHRQYGWSPDPARVELSAQITQALCCVLLSMTDPGDIVLTHAPTYPPFVSAVRDLGRRLVTIPARDVTGGAELLSLLPPLERPIRLILLCHPHNPTGHVFGQVTLEAVAELADRHDSVVFSDEIYQDLVYERGGYRPAAAIPGLAERTITYTSAAKSFNIPGLRCAVGHFGGAGLHDAYRRLPWHLRDGAGSLGIAATLAAWQHGEAWLAELRGTLRDNRDRTAVGVARLPGVVWTPPQAAFLAWLDFTGSVVAADPRTLLRRDAGVILQPGVVFGTTYPSHARLNFGTSPDRLRRILDRLCTALTGDGRTRTGASAQETAPVWPRP